MSQATPDPWISVAMASYGAAIELKNGRHWRSAVSRAYYAVYSKLSGCLRELGVAMPAGREGPSHGSLPDLVESNLTTLRAQERPRLASRLRELYRLRVLADYWPSLNLGEAEAQSALRLMGDVFHWLEEKAHGQSCK
jgi:HEPN domain-containing protein